MFNQGLTVHLVAGQSLLKLKPKDRNTYKGCSQKGVESCVPADLDIKLLHNGDSIELPDETKLTLVRRGQNVAVFQVWFNIL